MREVIKSFAEHAPPGLHLVVKEHPLDNGLSNWRKLVAKLAKAHNVADRVEYVEAGDIALIVRAAQGLITVNSTTGTLALACGVPVITLGYAVYDMPGITHQNGLKTFWNSPSRPETDIFAAFRNVLVRSLFGPGWIFLRSCAGHHSRRRRQQTVAVSRGEFCFCRYWCGDGRAVSAEGAVGGLPMISSYLTMDISRLLSRSHAAAPTGIDRVELAYAEYLMATSQCAGRVFCTTPMGLLRHHKFGVGAAFH